MFYTYVLNCRNSKTGFQRFYVGFTEDLRTRLRSHKTKGSTFTKAFDKVDLVYYEACLSEVDARNRELQLKTGFGRAYIKRRMADYLGELRD